MLVTRATLHNEDEITRKDVREGDLVYVQRAGDVIPQVLGTVPAGEPAPERQPLFHFPDHCPVCGALAVRPEGEVVRRCTGGLTCPAQAVERLIHFASRLAFDIEGLGERSIREFYDAGLIHTPTDIFRLKAHAAALEQRDGWGEQSVRNLLQAIDDRRTIPLSRFIYALGIRRIGESNARLLARHYGSYANWLQQMEAATIIGSDARLELGSITGIGNAIATDVVAFVAEPHNQTTLAELSAELTITEESAASGGPLAGKTIVFTGTLLTMTRPEAKATAERMGAKVSDSVSKRPIWWCWGKRQAPRPKKRRS